MPKRKSTEPGPSWADRSAPLPSKAPLGPDTGRYRCYSCGRIFRRYEWAEEHVNERHGGGRIAMLLEEEPSRD